MTVEPVVAPETSTPTAVPDVPQSLHEKLEATYDELTSEASAAEPAADAKPEPAATPEKAEPDSTEAVPSTEKPAETVPEKIEVTPEQLADTAYWGSLDEDGWKRMERDYPVATKLVKAGQAAASRIVNTARKQAPPPSAETRPEAQLDDEPSPELIAAVEMSQSLDPKEAAKGHLRIAQLTAPRVLKEQGIDPDVSRANAVYGTAYRGAMEQVPDLPNLDSKELNAIVEADPLMTALVNAGGVENLTLVMVQAAKALKAQKSSAAAAAKAESDRKATEAKVKETQRVVKSNARPATADVLSPSGATTNAKPTLHERLNAKYDEVAPTLSR